MTKTKTTKTHKNKTKKLKKLNNMKQFETLTPNQLEAICKKSPDNYESFEDTIEKVFKKNKIDNLASSYNSEKEVVKNIKTAVNTEHIIPNNDFYSYINERWIKSEKVDRYEKYIVEVDDFRLIQDKVYRELMVLLNKYVDDPKTKHTPFGKSITNAYASFKTFNNAEQTRQSAKKMAEKVDVVFASKDNLWQKLAMLNMNEIISSGAPFVWSINPDDKNPKIYKCYLEPPEVSLLDMDIYYNYDTDTDADKKYKSKYRVAFFKYLNNLFEIAFGKNHGYNVKDIWDCEIELLTAMSCDSIKKVDANDYNLISKKEALTRFGFNWEEFCKELGFKKIPESFVTPNVNYLLCATKLLTETGNNPTWKTYWIYTYIKHLCRWNEKGYHNNYEFNGEFVRGEEGMVDLNIRPIFPMGFTFNTVLTDLYKANYTNQADIDYVKMLAEDLKVVFLRIIQRNNWMNPKTKRIALDKLKNVKMQIGSPPILQDDPALNYVANDPWGNLEKKVLWRHERAIRLVGKPLIDMPIVDWTQIPPKFVSSQAYVVNAMYTPTANTVYIPLGYIQKPFVDLDERGIEYNLAYVGFAIAHELSHALDDFGSKYNKNGVLEDWWTVKDKAVFNKIQENLVKQYETYELYDGIKFDAWPSVGEDLADLVGFLICQEYLRDFQLKNEAVIPVQSLSFETFFLYFALQARQQISKKAIAAQLKTNPHPLDKYRCNIPLSRSRIFRAIYNVKKGDKMWWNTFNSVWVD